MPIMCFVDGPVKRLFSVRCAFRNCCVHCYSMCSMWNLFICSALLYSLEHLDLMLCFSLNYKCSTLYLLNTVRYVDQLA